VKARTIRDLDRLAKSIGATGWTLIRENKHLLVDFHLPDGPVRQVIGNTSSDRRAVANVRAQVRRSKGEGPRAK
jgi:hypothetical protein